MSTLIHFADLHISASEEAYSLGVLEEIMRVAATEKADFVLMAGDIFDTNKDAYDLREPFRDLINNAESGREILYLPGNHEILRCSGAELENLDLGKLNLLSSLPFSLLAREDIEILAVPHQDLYEGYRQWPVPPKQRDKKRIGLAHTNIAGMSFTGFEENGSVMDSDIFQYHQVDYAALGHIHDRRQQQINGTLLSYPGSARVWRKGETGPRGVNLVRTEGNLMSEFIPLSSAGEYRAYRLPLTFAGEADWDEEITNHWGPRDMVDLSLTGIVEDEHQVSHLIEQLESNLAPRLRKLTISREDVTIFNGISSHPLARNFMRLWKKREPALGDEAERQAWLEAREMGLQEIKSLLEARA